MPKRPRRIVFFLVLLIGGVGLVIWWLHALLEGPSVVRLPPGAKPSTAPGIEQEKLPIPVRVFKASRIDFTDILPTMGTVRGESEVELKFEVSGLVSSVNFREGDLVTEGQTLATLNDKEAGLKVEYATAKLNTAKTQLKLAEHRLGVNEKLYQLGAIIEPKLKESQIEVEQAQTQVATADRELDLASNEQEKTILKAPIEGVMGTRDLEVGAYVTPQTVVATLLEVGNVFVELGIIERDIERIRMGQRVKVTVDALSDAPFQGTIDNLAPVIEGKSRTLTAKVKVENPQGKLLPGMFARAEIAVFEKPNTLVVPTSSLKDMDGDGKFESVFVVEGETARVKPITLGYLTTDYAEIAQGLEEGAQVVTEARGPLQDGASVSLLETEEAGIQRAEPSLPTKGKTED